MPEYVRVCANMCVCECEWLGMPFVTWPATIDYICTVCAIMSIKWKLLYTSWNARQITPHTHIHTLRWDTWVPHTHTQSNLYQELAVTLSECVTFHTKDQQLIGLIITTKPTWPQVKVFFGPPQIHTHTHIISWLNDQQSFGQVKAQNCSNSTRNEKASVCLCV